METDSKKRKSKLIENKFYADGFKLCVVCGASMTGKTRALPKIIGNLYKPDEIFVYTNTTTCKNIKLYSELKHCFKGRNKPNLTITNCIPTNDDLAVELEELGEEEPPYRHRIIVFDDLSSKQMNNMVNYFRFGRHLNYSIFLLSQRYFSVPKEIRLQCNLVCIFRLPDGFSELYKKFKLYFDEDKDLFKSYTKQLNLRKNYGRHISIDMDSYEDAVKFV